MDSINQLKDKIVKFRNDRNWVKFHNPKDLAQAISIESAELLELMLWVSQEDSYKVIKEKREQVSDEMADIFIYLLSLSNVTKINLEQAVLNKLEKNNNKYPLKKVKGSAKKYTEYDN